jgi:hypothetical protein
MIDSKESDSEVIRGLLNRLTNIERETLRFNLSKEVRFSVPENAIPESGVG